MAAELEEASSAEHPHTVLIVEDEIMTSHRSGAAPA